MSSYDYLSWLLNIEIEQMEHKIMISQEFNLEKLKEKYKMGDFRTLETHLDVSSKLSRRD